MSDLLARWGTILAAAILLLALASAAPGFLSPFNLLNVLRQGSFLLVLTIGFTLALMAGELDLSFAAVASLAAVVCGGLVLADAPWPLAVLAALGVGAAVGALNGALVTGLAIPSLIATLATGTAAGGVAFMLTGGVAYTGAMPPDFLALARGSLAGVPALVAWSLGLLLLAQFVVKSTRAGAHLVMTGEAENAARLAGIRTFRVRFAALVASGACAGLAGVLLTAALASAGPTAAADFLMRGIAAALLGMTCVEPGKPNLPGAFAGVAIIGLLGNALVLAGAPYYTQDILLGAVIVAAVAASARRLPRAAFAVK